jgi:CubicO group peptidase (beta-lactamase class C family)
MQRITPGILVIFAALTVVPPAAEAHPFQHLRRQIIAEVESGTLPAFAIAVMFDGRIVWEEGFGSIGDESGLPVTAHTPFSLASVSKPITATALMALAQRGEIDLDRPIEEYLGGSRLKGHAGDASEATVRRVASHMAGLPLHFRFFTNGTSRWPAEQTFEQYALLADPPGAIYRYSNLGYRLLERALEVTTGKPLGEVLRDEVFEPLGMEGAALVTDDDPSAGRVRRRSTDGSLLPFYHSDHPGGSDVFASAHDLLRFAALHLGRLFPGQLEILDSRTREQMQRPLTLRSSDDGAYGIGWVIDGPVVGHTGGMPGTRASLQMLPHRRLAVVALASGESEIAIRTARQVIAHYQRPERHGAASRLERTLDSHPHRRNAPHRLRGEWNGSVVVGDSVIPLSMTVDRSGRTHVRLGEKERELRTARFSRSELTGWLAGGDLPDAALPSEHYILRFHLYSSGERLQGTVTTHGRDDSSLPFALGHWVELER